ncbi:MAG: DUF1700 domain-containing protein [Planctomycetota bacterium]|jgi:hypothetical protein
MINLSDRAKKCLDGYLQQIRTYLRGCKKVDADEVERNVIDHIESEFEGATAAVSFEELDTVLQRLGSPRQWIPEEELPWWRKTIFRLRTGPEDWRLVYISFGLLILGFVILPSFIILLPASFIVARAALSEAADPSELKSQKWLIYPSLIVGCSVIAFILFFGGTILGACLAEVLWDLTWIRRVAHVGTVVFAAGVAVSITALSWIILGAVFCKWPGLVRNIFKPFADWFNRKHAIILTCVGFALLVLTFAVVGYLRYVIFSHSLTAG